MSIAKVSKREYIELNSTYRNRNLYPYPAKFEVEVGKSGLKQYAQTALDPLAKAQTIKSFKGNIVGSGLTGTILAGVAKSPVLSIGAGANDYSFVGGIIQINSTPVQTSTVTRHDKTTNRIEVFPKFGSGFDIGLTFQFLDKSNAQHIFLAGGESETGKYVGMTLYNITINEYRTITAYKNFYLTLDTPFGGGWAVDNDYEIIDNKFIRSNTAQTVESNRVRLDVGASSVDDYYKNKFIRIYVATNTPSEGGAEFTGLITAYNGTTKDATVKIDTSLFTFPNTFTYEVFNFTKDLASYLNYIGHDDNQRALHRITLNSLILPNITLDNPIGGTIAFYPYVYVVFRNKSIGVNSLINSNNPNSRRATFRVPILDVPAKELTNFVRLASSMVNIFQFNPYEDLVFEVYLPDGTLFKTVEEDTSPPALPNEDVQISCNICLEKIS